MVPSFNQYRQFPAGENQIEIRPINTVIDHNDRWHARILWVFEGTDTNDDFDESSIISNIENISPDVPEGDLGIPTDDNP